MYKGNMQEFIDKLNTYMRGVGAADYLTLDKEVTTNYEYVLYFWPQGAVTWKRGIRINDTEDFEDKVIGLVKENIHPFNKK